MSDAPTGPGPEAMPLRISFELWSVEAGRLHLIPVGEAPLALGRYWPSGLSPDAIAFIADHCRCAYCNGPVMQPLAPCPCKKRKSRKYVLEVVYDRPKSGEAFKKVLAREDARAKGRSRAERLAANGGTLDEKELRELLAAQHERCYYCADSLIAPSGKPVFELDHYEPLYLGGAHTIENAVLACTPCNRRKGHLPPATFERKVRKERTEVASAAIALLRQSVKRWRTDRVKTHRPSQPDTSDAS